MLYREKLDPIAVKECRERILAAHTIALLPHHKPDGDALSACTALELFCRAHGVKVETIFPGGIPDDVPYPPQPLLAQHHTVVPDLLISCDTANQERLYLPPAFQAVPLIVIDHHVSNTLHKRAAHAFVVPEAASTCELVYVLLKEWGHPIDAHVAAPLLYGILYDTQCFRTSNTSAQTLEIAAALVASGAPLPALALRLTQKKDAAVVRLWGELMQRSQVSADNRVLWTSCTQADLAAYNLNEAATAGVVNQLAMMAPQDICIVFTEESDGVSRASLRSKNADVNELVKPFGGGGHRRAAGASSPLPLLEFIDAILTAAKRA